jgi:hypothetical protein
MWIVRHQEMGHSTKKNKVDNKDEWGAWQRANKKMKQQSSLIVKKRPNSKSIEQDIKDCH